MNKKLFDPDYGEGGGNIRTATILRTIMATGTAIAITSFLGTSLCAVQHPIDLNMCVVLTDNIFKVITSAGFFPQAIGGIGGVVIYWLSGDWHTN